MKFFNNSTLQITHKTKKQVIAVTFYFRYILRSKKIVKVFFIELNPNQICLKSGLKDFCHTSQRQIWLQQLWLMSYYNMICKKWDSIYPVFVGLLKEHLLFCCMKRWDLRWRKVTDSGQTRQVYNLFQESVKQYFGFSHRFKKVI